MKRITRPVRIAAIGLALVASLVAVTLYAQRPGGRMHGDGPGAGWNPAMIAERAIQGSWAFVSFELGVTDEQLVQLRKVYAKTWKQTREQLEAMRQAEPDARRQMMQGMMQSQRGLFEAVQAQLTPEQAQKLKEWYQKQMERAQESRGMMRRR